MKVGVLGSGDVGQVLGAGFASIGHQVKIGTRSPAQDKIRNWVAKVGANASAERFKHWQQTVSPFVETDYSRRLLHGLEAFFRPGPDGCGGALLVGWMPRRIVGAET